MFLWEIHKPWKFSPQGWVLAIVWNLSELFRVPMPRAGDAFGIIIGCKSKKITPQEGE